MNIWPSVFVQKTTLPRCWATHVNPEVKAREVNQHQEGNKLIR